MRSEEREKAYESARGAGDYLLEILLYGFVGFMMFGIFLNQFNIRTDDSDKDGWNRSGLKIHTDHLTGVQYVSTRGGGMHIRVDADGRPIISRK